MLNPVSVRDAPIVIGVSLAPKIVVPLEAEAKEKCAKLSPEAIARREKIKRQAFPLTPNSEIDYKPLGFIPPVLSFSAEDVCCHISSRLKEMLSKKDPVILGGAAAHIILEQCKYADVDIGFNLKYLAISEINQAVSEFVLERFLNDPALDRHAFIFKYLLPHIAQQTDTNIHYMLTEFFIKATADRGGISERLRECRSGESLEKTILYLKQHLNLDLIPSILEFLKTTKLVEKNSGEAILEMKDLMFAFIAMTYMYKTREIKAGLEGLVCLVIDLGGVDLKFINANASQYRSFVALHDSLCVAYEDDYFTCESGPVQDSVQALFSHTLIVPDPKKVMDLAFRISLYFTKGLDLPGCSNTVDIALDQLKTNYALAIESKHKSDVHPLAVRFHRHQQSHYFRDDIGRLFDFINFIFLLTHLKNSAEQCTLLRIVAGACHPDSLEHHFAMLVNHDPKSALHFLNLLWGIFLCEWVRKNPAVSLFQFQLKDDQGKLHERFTYHIAFDHAKGRHYLAIPRQSPDRLAKDFVSAWLYMQEVCKKDPMGTNIARHISSIFKTLGIGFDLFSTDCKKNALDTLLNAFESPPLSQIIRDHFLHTPNPLEKISRGVFYDFLAKYCADSLEWQSLEGKRIRSDLIQYQDEAHKLKLDAVKCLCEVMVQRIYQIDAAGLKLLAARILAIDPKHMADDAHLRDTLSRALFYIVRKLTTEITENTEREGLKPDAILLQEVSNLLLLAKKNGILNAFEKNVCIILLFQASNKIPWKRELTPDCKPDKAQSSALTQSVLAAPLQLASLEGMESFISKCIYIGLDSPHRDELHQKIIEVFVMLLKHALDKKTPLAFKAAAQCAERLLKALKPDQNAMFLKENLETLVELGKLMYNLPASQADCQALGISLVVLCANQGAPKVSDDIQKYFLKRMANAFLLSKAQPVFKTCADAFSRLESVQKEKNEALLELQGISQSEMWNSTRSVVLDRFIKFAMHIDVEVAKTINKSEHLKGQMLPQNMEVNILLAIQHQITKEKTKLNSAYEEWAASQYPRDAFVSHTDKPAILMLKIQTASKLLTALFEDYQKEDLEKVNALSTCVILLLRTHKHLLKEGEIIEGLSSMLQALCSEKAKRPELEIADRLSQEIAVCSALGATVPLDLLNAQMLSRYLQLERVPAIDVLTRILRHMFKKSPEATAKRNPQAFIQPCLDMVRYVLKEKEGSSFGQMATDIMKNLLQSEILDGHWNADTVNRCIHLISEIHSSVPITRTDELINCVLQFAGMEFVPLIRDRVQFLQLLMNIRHEQDIIAVWYLMEQIQPFSPKELQAICPSICMENDPALIKLVYLSFQKIGHIDPVNCQQIYLAMCRIDNDSFVDLIRPDGLLRKGMQFEILPLEEKLKIVSALFQHIARFTCRLPAGLCLRHTLLQSLENEWQWVSEIKPIEALQSPLDHIRSCMIEIYARTRYMMYLVKACNLFNENPTAQAERLAILIVERFLSLKSYEYTTEDPINLCYHFSQVVARKKLINLSKEEIIDILNDINSISEQVNEQFELGNQRALEVHLLIAIYCCSACLSAPIEAVEHGGIRLKKTTHEVLSKTLSTLLLASYTAGRNENIAFIERIAQKYLDKSLDYRNSALTIIIRHTKKILSELKNPSTDRLAVERLLFTTRVLLPLYFNHDDKDGDSILNFLYQYLTKCPQFYPSIHEVLKAGDKIGMFKTCMEKRMDTQALLLVLMFHSEDASDHETATKCLEAFNNMSCPKSLAAKQRCTVDIIDILSDFRCYQPDALTLALDQLLRLMKMTDITNRDQFYKVYACTQIVVKNFLLWLISTPDAKSDTKYQKFLSIVTYLSNSKHGKDNDELKEGLQILEVILQILSDYIHPVLHQRGLMKDLEFDQAAFKKSICALSEGTLAAKLKDVNETLYDFIGTIKGWQEPYTEGSKDLLPADKKCAAMGVMPLIYACHSADFRAVPSEVMLDRSWDCIVAILNICIKGKVFYRINSINKLDDIMMKMNVCTNISKAGERLPEALSKKYALKISGCMDEWKKYMKGALQAQMALISKVKEVSPDQAGQAKEIMASFEAFFKEFSSPPDTTIQSEADLFAQYAERKAER